MVTGEDLAGLEELKDTVLTQSPFCLIQMDQNLGGVGRNPGSQKQQLLNMLFNINRMYRDGLTLASTLSKFPVTAQRSLLPPWLASPACQAQLVSFFISSHLPWFCFVTSSLG